MKSAGLIRRGRARQSAVNENFLGERKRNAVAGGQSPDSNLAQELLSCREEYFDDFERTRISVLRYPVIKFDPV